MEEAPKLLSYKIKWEAAAAADDDEHKSVCKGKVKALTTYFNSLPYMMDDCNCVNVHQSTPNLSVTQKANSSKLSKEEENAVRKQLKEWSEFGLRKQQQQQQQQPPQKDKLVCSFMERAESSPLLCLSNEEFAGCRKYHDVLNKLDKVACHRSVANIRDFKYQYNPLVAAECFHHKPPVHSRCQSAERPTVVRSEKHRCRSACFNIKDPAKKKKKKQQNVGNKNDDDNESLII